jgi:hypothetical protein
MSITETEKKYLESESTTIDNAMLYRELKGLREELKAIKENTGSEIMTKEKILAIKDRGKRLAAISENWHLFQNK